jgi:general secretion pathway protein D
MRRIKSFWYAAVLLLGAGCASDTNFTQGKRLLSEGKPDLALPLLERATRDNPRDLEMRTVWIRERDALVNKHLTRAETARAQNQLAEANEAYREVQKNDPGNARAKAGLDGIVMAHRHENQLREAEGLLAKQNLAQAESAARNVLSENPAHYGARTLLRRIVDATATRNLAPPVLKAAVGKTVNLEFRDANLRNIFEVISRTSGINFVFDKDVRPDLRTTIMVRDSTVDDVIKLVLMTNQLDRKVLNDNTLLVYPNTPAKLKEYQDLVVRSFYLTNADVKQTVNMIRTVVKTRDLYIDEKLNMLVMKDTPEAVRLAEKLIAAQDLADPEVILEMEVLEISSSRAQELGVRFPEQVVFQSPASLAAGATVARLSDGLTGFVATPTLLVNLKQQDGVTNVLANPRIRVKNREKAKVHIGDKVPVITTTSTANVGVSASVTYLDVGLKLDVEPNIQLDGEVVIKAGLEVSNITKQVAVTGGGLAYQVGTRNASTVLRLRDGETQVLAGLIQDEERSTANRLPGLGNLPLLGRLFSNNNDNRTKTEIVLLITPRIVRTLTRPEYVVAEYFSGTESAVGAAPLSISPTPARGLAISSNQGAPVAPGAPQARAPASSQNPMAGPVTVLLSGATETKIGADIALSLSLPPQTPAASARFDLVYDPALLAPQGAPAGAAPGRLNLALSRSGASGDGPQSTTVNFRAIAKSPGSTQISVENADFREEGGASIPATQPAAHSLTLTQ